VLEIAFRIYEVETQMMPNYGVYWWCGIMGRQLRDTADILTSLIEQTNKKWKRIKFIILLRKPFKENKNVNLGTYNF
jgi:hypothetical protein